MRHADRLRRDAAVSSLIGDAAELCSVTRQATQAVINDLPQRRLHQPSARPASVRPSSSSSPPPDLHLLHSIAERLRGPARHRRGIKA